VNDLADTMRRLDAYIETRAKQERNKAHSGTQSEVRHTIGTQRQKQASDRDAPKPPKLLN